MNSITPLALSVKDGAVQENGSRLKLVNYRAKQTLMQYLQDLPDAGKLASSSSEDPSTKPQKNKTANGKPKLVLMGQRRFVLSANTQLCKLTSF